MHNIFALIVRFNLLWIEVLVYEYKGTTYVACFIIFLELEIFSVSKYNEKNARRIVIDYISIKEVANI